MKKFISIFLIISFIFISSCSEPPPEIDPSNPAHAYYLIFEALINESVGLNNDSIYIALELTDVELPDTAPLIQLVQNYCDTNEYTLLLMGFEELKEKGYIDYSDTDIIHFKEGIMISFYDKESTDTKLVTSGHKWKSGLGAVGMEFTVEKINDSWQITEEGNSWRA